MAPDNLKGFLQLTTGAAEKNGGRDKVDGRKE